MVAAIGGAAVAIIGVVVLIGLVLAVMLPSEANIDELAQRTSKKLRQYIERNPSLLQGWDSLTALGDAYRQSVGDLKQAMDDYYSSLRKGQIEAEPATQKTEQKARLADAYASYVDSQVAYVTKVLAVEQLQEKLGPLRRFLALVSAAAIGAGIGFYAWGTNAPKGATAASAPPTALRGVRLAGADLRRANVRGAALLGARLENVKWSNTTCPDGSNSDAHKSSCEDHLKAP